MSINVVTISGNLGRDAELKSTQSGVAVLSFSVCVNDRKKDPASGEWRDVPNWIECVLFGARAKSLSRCLTKGTKVSVAGKLSESTWEVDGQKRSKIRVLADNVDFTAEVFTDDLPF